MVAVRSSTPARPPINKPSKAELAARGGRAGVAGDAAGRGPIRCYDYWKDNLKPGGFKFAARIINYPGGVPGDVGLFFSWPKSSLEASDPAGSVRQVGRGHNECDEEG